MDPRFAEAEAALKANRVGEAVALLIAALEAGPGPLGAYRQLGAKLYAAGRYVDGERWLREGLKHFPKDLELLNSLGVMLRRQQRLDEALAVLDQAAKLHPKATGPMINKANVLNDLREGARALELGQRLVRLQPANAEFHRIVARAYRHLGQLENAAARLEVAIRMAPKDADAWLDRAGIASALQKHEEAAEIVGRALKAIPDNAQLGEAQAVMMRRAGRNAESEAQLRARLEAGDAPAWVYFQLGRTIADFDRKQSNAYFRKAIELEPGKLKLRLILADSLDRSRFDNEGENIQAAYDTLIEALDLGTPPIEDIYVSRQIALRVGDYALLAKQSSFNEFGRHLAKAGTHGPFLQHLGRVEAPEDRYEIIEQHKAWGATVEAQAARNPIKRPPPRPKDGRIRLGFMSSDLRNHPVGYFALPLFQHIDRARFDVYCYSFYTGEADSAQKFITSQVTAFRWVKAISDRGAAQMVADDQLDMLIELGGSTHMNKLESLAYRPAPLQASWLGYPHSAGLSAIDYLVVDPYIQPEDPALLIEKPMVMPHTWLCLGRAQFRDSIELNPTTPEERNGYVTFGSANNTHKYNPAMLRTWAKVVASVPESRFLWVRPEGGARIFRENMLAIFAEEGVAPERVRFEAVRGAHLPFYNEMDITLDTFPLTGGTTTCETLWMGVPVVSLVGAALFERLSYSVLTNAGLGDLAVHSLDDFVATAVALAANPARRMLLRATLRDQIKASPLYQHEAFAKDFYDLVARTVAAYQ